MIMLNKIKNTVYNVLTNSNDALLSTLFIVCLPSATTCGKELKSSFKKVSG